MGEKDRGGAAMPCQLCREDLISRGAKTRNWLIGILILICGGFAVEQRLMDGRMDACAQSSDLSEINTALKEIAKYQSEIKTDIAIIKTKQGHGIKDINDEIARSKTEDERLNDRLDGHDDRIRRIE